MALVSSPHTQIHMAVVLAISASGDYEKLMWQIDSRPGTRFASKVALQQVASRCSRTVWRI
jgi:hypothetical protein